MTEPTGPDTPPASNSLSEEAAEMNRTTILSCCLLGLSLAACTVSSPTQRVERDCATVRLERQFVDQPIAILEICAHQGHVVVRGGDAPSCRVDAGVVADGRAEAERLAHEVDLQTSHGGAGVLRLALEPGPGLRLDDLHGRWEICAPKNVWVRVVSIDADVTVRGNVGTVEIVTKNGKVRSSSGGGEIICRRGTKQDDELLVVDDSRPTTRAFSR